MVSHHFNPKHKGKHRPEPMLAEGPPGYAPGKENVMGYSFQELSGWGKALNAGALCTIFFGTIAGVFQIDNDNGIIHITGPQLSGGDDASGHTMHKGSDRVDNDHNLNQPSIGRAVQDKKTVISAGHEGDEPVAAHPKRIRAGKSRGLSAPPMMPFDKSLADSHQNVEKQEPQEQIPGCPITYLNEPKINSDGTGAGYNVLILQIENGGDKYDFSILAEKYILALGNGSYEDGIKKLPPNWNIKTLANLLKGGHIHSIKDGKNIEINMAVVGNVVHHNGFEFDLNYLIQAIGSYNNDCASGVLKTPEPPIIQTPTPNQELSAEEIAKVEEQEKEKTEKEKARKENEIKLKMWITENMYAIGAIAVGLAFGVVVAVGRIFSGKSPSGDELSGDE